MKKRSAKVTSYIMSCVRSSKTQLEERMSKQLWKAGLRGYRRNVKSILGRPDFVWSKQRVVVFCDSSFWHGYKFKELIKRFKNNSDYWIPKIKRNIQRDKKCTKQLRDDNWKVLRFWDFQMEKDIKKCVAEVQRAVKSPQPLTS